MDVTIRRAAAPLHGELTVPTDKSICHRAVLLGALAKGTTEIRPWPAADDCQRTLELVARLGCDVTRSSEQVSIQGSGGTLREPTEALFCGESGTTLRIAAGLLAGQPLTARLTASPALCRRPMQRVVEPLARMGAQVSGEGSAAAGEEAHPPLTIRGHRPLRAIRYEMPVASAQVKSAVLLAGLSGDGPTTVVEPRRTRDHTERMLEHFGAQVVVRGSEVSVEPGPLTSPGRLELPGDFSSAVFLVVAAAIVPGSRVSLRGVSLNPTRIQLLKILQRMGASVQWKDGAAPWEPRGTVTVDATPLRGVTLAEEEIPGVIDELPALMVAAACASGRSTLQGLAELRVKETDRVQSMVRGLGQLGAQIRVGAGETVEIDGGPLRGTAVESAGDHRTAMSLAVAGLAAEGATVVRGAECVAKSFPEFFDLLRDVTASSTVSGGEKRVDKG